MKKEIIEYYNKNGYKPTVEYIKKLNRSGDINLNERAIYHNMVTEIYLQPSRRSAVRDFNDKLEKSSSRGPSSGGSPLENFFSSKNKNKENK